MFRRRFISICLCLLAASLARGAGESKREHNPGIADFSGGIGRAPTHAWEGLRSPPAEAAARHEIHDPRAAMLMAAESDDDDPLALRLKAAVKSHRCSRVATRTSRIVGHLAPAWAHDADFFPNTLHVRLQI